MGEGEEDVKPSKPTSTKTQASDSNTPAAWPFPTADKVEKPAPAKAKAPVKKQTAKKPAGKKPATTKKPAGKKTTTGTKKTTSKKK